MLLFPFLKFVIIYHYFIFTQNQGRFLQKSLLFFIVTVKIKKLKQTNKTHFLFFSQSFVRIVQISCFILWFLINLSIIYSIKHHDEYWNCTLDKTQSIVD